MRNKTKLWIPNGNLWSPIKIALNNTTIGRWIAYIENDIFDKNFDTFSKNKNLLVSIFKEDIIKGTIKAPKTKSFIIWALAARIATENNNTDMEKNIIVFFLFEKEIYTGTKPSNQIKKYTPPLTPIKYKIKTIKKK